MKHGFIRFFALLICIGFSPQCKSNDQNTKAESSELPKNLSIILSPDSVNKVDLRGSGSSDDLLIRGYEETGTAYAPTIYMLLTGNGDNRNKYHFVSIPHQTEKTDFYAISAWSSGDCFATISTFLKTKNSASPKFFFIRAMRNNSITEDSIKFGAEIELNVYILNKKDQTPDSDLGFYIIKKLTARSKACNEDDILKFEQDKLEVTFDGVR